MLFCYVGKELSMRNIKADTSGCWIERERERECVRLKEKGEIERRIGIMYENQRTEKSER